MQFLSKHLLSTAAILFALTPSAIGESEPKYPIFERENYPNISGSQCQGDKELVWARGRNGISVTPRVCRQKCPADWITTKLFCIKDKTVHFPRPIRYIGRSDPCAGGEEEMGREVLHKLCIETCPKGMVSEKDSNWCVTPENVKPTVNAFGKFYNSVTHKNECEKGMDLTKLDKYAFCAKPLKAK